MLPGEQEVEFGLNEQGSGKLRGEWRNCSGGISTHSIPCRREFAGYDFSTRERRVVDCLGAEK